ncbi:unnamed protein product [Cylindrotheca closterium]|uniref:SnoaL-like domain-containing protein n=1 Tax=Cylindrotheca closterium TaxID=2856 RepID=A0AAD2FKY6_9STRA|nr:unnamed protein product [Cylindrotheca closterium]
MSEEGSSPEGIPRNITQLAERKIRLAKAQAEVDRILNCPIDPPFDTETELEKVISISPPLVSENSIEYANEEQISEMEAELYQAVKKQEFAKASEIGEAISQKHVDDCGLVLQANSRFYDAFSKKDPAAMESIWLQDRSCICIHPSHKPLVGAKNIMSSWRDMFESSNGSFQRSWMEPQEVRITVQATTAIITCEEHVFTRRFVRGKTRETELVNKLQATNVFRKIGGKWYLSYHHSSWHAGSEAAKVALKHSKGEDTSKDGEDDKPTPAISSILRPENVGPILGDPKSGSLSKSGPKKVIMGSLSDLLSGQLGDIMGGGSNDADEGIEELLGGGIEGMGPMGPGKAIIRVHNIGGSSNVGNGSNDVSGPTYEWASDDDDDIDSSLEGGNKKKSQQKCIELLRKLAIDGRVSQKQKRILLTDIISCSSKGENSMVEVAFELLCGESGNDEDAEEDFADQCRILADQKFE